MVGEEGEFLTYFPEYTEHIKKIQKVYYDYIDRIEKDSEGAKKFLEEERTPENRKNYAMWAKNGINVSFLFQLYDGNVTTYQEYINEMTKRNGSKNVAKGLMKTLKIKDIEWEAE